jgi:hypothetical protein
VFNPVEPGVWRWSTPDPADPWMMVGHLLETPDGVVLVDPPVVPGLVDAVCTLKGGLGIVLTTHDHVRGAGWLHRQLGCPVFAPHQSMGHPLIRDHLPHAIPYDEATALPAGLAARRARAQVMRVEDTEESAYVDEMVLLTATGAVLTGDLAMGGPHGELWGCPEGLTLHPDPEKVRASLAVFQSVVPADVRTLLASHGDDVVGSLAKARRQRNLDSTATK